MKMKKLVAMFLVGLMALNLAGCGSDQQDAASDQGQGQAEALAEKTVAIATPYLTSATTQMMVTELEEGLQNAGVGTNTVGTADYAELASRLEDLVTMQVDAIVLVSVDVSEIQTQVQHATSAGIPVFGVDSGYMEGMQVNATSDNYAMGEMMTTYLFHDLMQDEGTVVALTHRPHPGVIKRSEAFDALRADYPGITLLTEQHVDVPNQIENARQITENLCLSYPNKGDITAIWCGWDEAAIGAAQALRDNGREEIMVIGVDGNEQAVALIDEGSNLVATVAQDFTGMCEIVTNDVVALFEGQPIETGEKYAPGRLIVQDGAQNEAKD